MKILDFLTDRKLKAMGYASRRTRTALADIHYYEAAGRAGREPIVIVHGIGSRAEHFHDVLPALVRAGHPVIALDLPWHGRSSALSCPMRADALHECLTEALSSIAPKRFALVGNSLGGALSLRYASFQPDRVSCLLLTSPAVGFTSESDWLALRKLLDINSRADCLAFLKRVFHRQPFYLPLIIPAFKDAITRPGVRELVTTTSYTDFLPPEGFVVYPGKTLLVWGKQELLFPRANFEWLRGLLPAHTEYSEPTHIGHCPHFDDPRWFAKKVLDFVGKV